MTTVAPETPDTTQTVASRDRVSLGRMAQRYSLLAIWLVMGKGGATDLLWRVWSGGTSHSMADIMSAPTKEAVR